MGASCCDSVLNTVMYYVAGVLLVAYFIGMQFLSGKPKYAVPADAKKKKLAFKGGVQGRGKTSRSLRVVTSFVLSLRRGIFLGKPPRVCTLHGGARLTVLVALFAFHCLEFSS